MVGERGLVLLQDFFLQEKLAQFNRERIPERVVMLMAKVILIIIQIVLMATMKIEPIKRKIIH